MVSAPSADHDAELYANVDPRFLHRQCGELRFIPDGPVVWPTLFALIDTAAWLRLRGVREISGLLSQHIAALAGGFQQ